MLYAFLNMFLWPGFQFFVFYKGYHALCQGPNHSLSIKLYYCGQVTLMLFWVLFLFIHKGAFNGIFKFSVLVKCSLKFSIAVSIVELLLYCSIIGLSGFCLKKVKEFYGQDPYK